VFVVVRGKVAPYVGLKKEDKEGVEGDVVFDGVGDVVCFDDLFIRLMASTITRRGGIGWRGRIWCGQK